MERTAIIPYEHLEDIIEPVIFLAGPIKGAPNWQNEAVKLIHSMDSGIYTASPAVVVNSKYIVSLEKSKPKFTSRLAWERYYLELASKKGAILFWLPNETQHDCEHVYGRDTRGEIAEWRGCLKYDRSIRIVIGGEKEFDGFDIIKRNYLAVTPDMKFYSTLEETCREAVKLARK